MHFYSPNCEIKPGMSLPEGVTRVALVVEYDGAGYQGFQRQASAKKTVQGELEAALTAVAAAPITLVCAGRTDAGVHATRQVVHFDTYAQRPERAWLEGVNTQMSPAVRVVEVHPVPGEFHARFSAQARTYRYFTYSSRVRPAILAGKVSWLRTPLQLEPMIKAAGYLLGEKDFSAFRASQCQAHSPVRNVLRAELHQCGAWTLLEIQANAFLHHMVRNIMGSLYQVGMGNHPPEWIAELLESKDRRLAAPTAPADGLYFVAVQYPESFRLPSRAQGPCFYEWFGLV